MIPSPKRCIIPSSLNNCIEVMLLMLLIAQITMIIRNESMKIKRQFQRDIHIIVKAVGCLGSYGANIPRTWANALRLGLFVA